jgi:hypothetical protein
MAADLLTKPLPFPKFKELLTVINIGDFSHGEGLKSDEQYDMDDSKSNIE